MGRWVFYSDAVRGWVVTSVTHLSRAHWQCGNALESNLLWETLEGNRLGNLSDIATVRGRMMFRIGAEWVYSGIFTTAPATLTLSQCSWMHSFSIPLLYFTEGESKRNTRNRPDRIGSLEEAHPVYKRIFSGRGVAPIVHQASSRLCDNGGGFCWETRGQFTLYFKKVLLRRVMVCQGGVK